MIRLMQMLLDLYLVPISAFRAAKICARIFIGKGILNIQTCTYGRTVSL